jgi:hypothetical protein
MRLFRYMSDETPKESADSRSEHPPAPASKQEPPAAAAEETITPADQPGELKARRSIEFWVALVSSAIAAVGVAATATVGIWAAQLAYKSSANQVAAESERSRIQFSREQRKTVYLEFLNHETTLHNEALKLWNEFAQYAIDPSDPGQLDRQIDSWTKLWENTPRVVNAANLFASQPVYGVLVEWAMYDNDVRGRVAQLLDIVDAGNPLPSKLVADLGDKVHHQPSARHFEEVAQFDLGLTQTGPHGLRTPG